MAPDILFFGLLIIMAVMYYKGRNDEKSKYRVYGNTILFAVLILVVYSGLDERSDTRRYCERGFQPACEELDLMELYDDMNQ
jgi:hypothetical protein